MANKDFKVKNGIDIQSPLPVSMGGTGQTSTTNTLNSLLPAQSGNNNKYLQTDGSNVSWSNLPTPTFVQMTTTSINSNITLSSNNRYLVDTSSARTLTLPSSPLDGDEIQIIDKTGSAATNNITISSNGLKINGSVQDGIIDIAYYGAVLIYTGSSYGWRFN